MDIDGNWFILVERMSIRDNNRYIYFNRKINDRDLRERICLDAISAAEMKTTPSILDAESDKETKLMTL